MATRRWFGREGLRAMAFWVDRWNSGRTEVQRERGVLQQLAVELAADTADLNSNLRNNADARAARDRVLQWMDGERSLDTATVGDFGTGMIFTNFVANAAAYENLKSIGVDLISDPALRLEITQYYESSYTFVGNTEAALLNPHWSTDLLPRMLRHFDVVFWTQISWPRDEAALRADRELRSSIASFSQMVEFADGATVQAVARAEALVGRIESRLADR
jgi:hypothetical protein